MYEHASIYYCHTFVSRARVFGGSVCTAMGFAGGSPLVSRHFAAGRHRIGRLPRGMRLKYLVRCRRHRLQLRAKNTVLHSFVCNASCQRLSGFKCQPVPAHQQMSDQRQSYVYVPILSDVVHGKPWSFTDACLPMLNADSYNTVIVMNIN